jgi:hypothetical protein
LFCINIRNVYLINNAEKSSPIWGKTDFPDDGELLDYLLEKYKIGRLRALQDKELAAVRKKDWQEVELMDKDDFIDVR